MNSISKDYVLIFHKGLIERFGGSHGLRDENALESALNSAFQTFDGIDLYKTDIEKIAAICYSLIANHAFVDGNKRIGIHIMLTLLKFNHYDIDFAQAELIGLGLGIASGKAKQQDIFKWIEAHLRNTPE